MNKSQTNEIRRGKEGVNARDLGSSEGEPNAVSDLTKVTTAHRLPPSLLVSNKEHRRAYVLMTK